MRMPWRDRQRMRIPETELHRQVLLDHHLAAETGVHGQIRDPESAGAKDSLDDELLDPSAGREGLGADG